MRHVCMDETRIWHLLEPNKANVTRRADPTTSCLRIAQFLRDRNTSATIKIEKRKFADRKPINFASHRSRTPYRFE
jgi:hypothetical protein